MAAAAGDSGPIRQVVKTNQQRQRDHEMGTEVMCDVNGSRLSFNGYRQRRHINEWSIKGQPTPPPSVPHAN